MGTPLHRGVDLSGVGQVNVKGQRILYPCGVDVLPAGYYQPGCTMSLRIADVATGDVSYIPLPSAFARKLAEQLIHTADQVEENHRG